MLAPQGLPIEPEDVEVIAFLDGEPDVVCEVPDLDGLAADVEEQR
ncbi:MAG: hypothetical protein KatS3mg065_1108 [Chloroflexota bacterium]|nr:MAG: hypothetical protein KatS3mg065_1108 [Chloroflexota bacterium]